ncbi:ribonuclease M5 [Thermicanus aegyptius]|uniref:ribonuclease M5 n=1 Tax=Thermicanus aegyptius TaxID=94009 RepID=UPI0003F64E50|nr:ribonuclease M5 [Thermicanus aegyptius]
MAEEKEMIQEMIVVEGKNDTAAVKRAVNADTIETGGAFVSESVLLRIRRAQKVRGVILLTDPDHAGETIRKRISREIPGVKHAFISKEEGWKEGDIGVENASPETIRKALSHLRTEQEGGIEPVSWEELIDLGLVGSKRSSMLRGKVGEILGIGYANGKQFHMRLRVFSISREEFLDAYEKALRGERDGK